MLTAAVVRAKGMMPQNSGLCGAEVASHAHLYEKTVLFMPKGSGEEFRGGWTLESSFTHSRVHGASALSSCPVKVTDELDLLRGPKPKWATLLIFYSTYLFLNVHWIKSGPHIC